MKVSQVLQVAAVAAAVVGSGAASAQLANVGTFGQATYSSASAGYSPGRTMTWNGGANFKAYCIDPYTSAALPGSYTQMSLDSFTNGTATSSYAGQIGRGGGYTGLATTAAAQTTVRNDIKELFSWAYTSATSVNTAKAAAFGLVLWEIIMQNGGTVVANGGTQYSRTAGTMKSTGGDTTNGNFGSSEALSTDKVEYWLNAYLSALNTNNWTGVLGGTATQTNWTYTVYYDGVSPVSQTFISVAPPGAVPEPTSLALAGLALAGVGYSRRRKNAK